LHKDIQAKARRDIEVAIEKHGQLTYESVGDMKYLEQCMNGDYGFCLLLRLCVDLIC